MAEEAALLPGTLDVLILKAVSLAPEHGYGVLLRIEQMTGGALLVEQGALYPALARLEHQGLLDPSGARPTTTGAPSSTASPPPAVVVSRPRRNAGTGSR